MNKTALIAALIVATATSGLAGCTFSGQAQAGGAANGGDPPPPPPPPAAPAATPAPAEPAPAPAAPIKPDAKGRIDIPGNIVFDSNSAVLKEGAGSEVVLDQAVQYMKENPQVTLLRVEGHTDNVGEPAANMKLSGARALTVKNYLISKGIEAPRLIAAGFGETRPVADNGTEEGKAQNRRIEFKIAELKKRPYLGLPTDGGGTVVE